MLTWAEFARAEPALAEAGRALLYQYGVGLGFLATVRRDGGPRVHPICPLLDGDGLYAFITPSPKRHDLLRDGRYALHSFPTEQNEDGVYLTGRVRPAPGPRSSLERRFLAERRLAEPPRGMPAWQPFELLIERCLLTRTSGHGDEEPRHTVWRAP